MRSFRNIAGAVAVFCAAATGMGAQKVAPVSDQLQVGDRIALVVEGPAALSDTVVVREGEVIHLPNIGEISVQGVRRSEVQAFLTREIGKYVKDPVVHAVALVRIGVVGAVMRPGYYSVPSDFVLSDVLMEAGGPVANADINSSTIQRSGKDFVGKKRVAQALATGATLDELQIVSGDQIVVGERSRGNLDNLLRISGVVVGLAGVAVALAR